MALVLLDRAKETTIVLGTTASAILLGAVSGYQSLAGVGNANTTYYCIADQSGGANWEVGIGTYTLATTTLTRAATPLSSSNAGATVSFSAGTKDVFIVYPSEKGIWLDASGNAIGLGTPAAFVGTNITGTATSFTASNVTTNANLTGDITSVGNATTLTNAPVIAKVLTGYVSGAGTVAATDSILQAIQKLNGNDATNANLTGMVTSVGNTTTVVTNANLTGAITSVGNASSLGSFTSLQLATALTDETGTGSLVFATSPTLVTPALGTPSSGTVTNLTGTASININGTVGATTATTGVFTTLSVGNAYVINGGLLGYGAGSGGTVTQATSKTTNVTLNKPSGMITMNAAALAAGASVLFRVNNTMCNVSTNVIVNGSYSLISPENYRIECSFIGASVFGIRVTNISAGSLSEALLIAFSIINGVVA